MKGNWPRLAHVIFLLAWAGLATHGVAQHQTYSSPNTEVSGFFGYDVAVIGDLTGDGMPDLIVGAHQEDDNAFFDTGRVYVVNGATGAILRTIVSPQQQAYGHFGYAVAGIGDVTGDGIPDLAAGAPNESSYSGRVHFFNGSTGVLIRTLISPNTQNNGGFGKEVSTLRDITGDGIRDVIVGADNEDAPGSGFNGRVYVFNGATGALVHTLNTPNPATGGRFGEHAVDVGDVSGDGISDIIVGAHIEDNTERSDGSVYVFNGATGLRIYTLLSPNPTSLGSFGWAVAGVGDLTGDGLSDILVGSFETVGSTTQAGRSYLFNGSTGALVRTLTSPSPEGFGYYGFAACGLPDQNGDGVRDIAVAAYAEDSQSATNDGKIYITSGADGSVLNTILSPTAMVEGNFGFTMAEPTTNSSGHLILPVGAHREEVNGTMDAGHAHLLNLTTHSLPVELVGFDALLDASHVHLRWTTQSETNNSGYEVEQRMVHPFASQDHEAAEQWERIGFVQGHGTTFRPQHYRFSVAPVVPGRYQYRLRQVDFDGAFALSSPVEVIVQGESLLAVETYPNPMHTQGEVVVIAPTAAHVEITIYDSLGRQVQQWAHRLDSQESVLQTSLDVSGWANGTYWMQTVASGRRVTRPIIVQR